MKSFLRSWTLFFFASAFGGVTAFAAGEEKAVEFQGTVAALNPEAKTITVRAREKEFVFQIEPERCSIVKEGRFPDIPGSQPAVLRSAQIGDAVIGSLVVQLGKPVVTHLYLTSKPETGVRVTEKPGFIISPYHSDQSTAANAAIDVRGYRRGTLLVDKTIGKIFLVP